MRRGDLKRILADAASRTSARDSWSADDQRDPDGPDEAGKNPLPSYGVHVLLAEDNPVNQELGREYFKRMGCPVTVASSGLEAVEQCENG